MSTLAENDRLSPTYTATVGQTDFPGDFPVLTDPATGQPCGVAIRRVRDAVEATLVLGVDFTIPTQAAGSFVARLATGAQAGDKIQVYGLAPTARNRAHGAGGVLKTDTLEGDAMQFAAALQEQRRDIDRAVAVPLGEAGLVFPALEARASHLPVFDAAGALGVFSTPEAVVVTNAAGAVIAMPINQLLTEIGVDLYDDGEWSPGDDPSTNDDGVWG